MASRSSGCVFRWSACQHVQDVPNRLLTIGKLRQRQLGLHLVAVSPTFSLLHDVAGIRQIGHDGVCVSLGDTEVRCDLAQPNIGILRDAEQGPAVVGEEAPIGHLEKVPEYL